MSKLSETLAYANHIEANQKTINWIEHNLKNYLEKNNPATDEVEHIIDYLAQSTIINLDRVTYEQAKIKSEKWVLKLQQEASKIVEKKSDVKLIHDFKDGFRIVQLVGENAYKREGKLMSNCVASYYGKNVEIYSLRDKFNNPHCTMEKNQQVKGKGNGDIDPKYVGYVVKFLELIGMTVGESEMAHLGYVDVSDIEDKNAVFPKLFNNKWFYKKNDILDKDGNKYQNMTLWDKFNIFDLDLKLNINWNFDIALSIKTFLANFKPTKKDSGDYAQLASSGYSAQLASSGDYAQLASSGYSAKLASSGDYAQLELGGKQSVGANIGYSGTIKGIKGCWITLAEYDNNYNIKYVKSAKIDGVKLKEDT